MRLTDYRYLLSRVAFPDGYFVEDPQLGADHARNQPQASFSMRGPSFNTFTNSLGCFDEDNEIQSDYILAIGDSATWGFVPDDKNWTHVLQSMSGKQVLNCGVTGVGTRFELFKAQRVIEEVGLVPALVLLLYVNNDLNDDHVFPSYTVVAGQRFDRVRSIDLRTGEVTRYSKAELTSAYRSYRDNELTPRQILRNHSLTAWLIYRALFQQEHDAAGIDESVIEQRYGIDFWNLPINQYPWLGETIEYHMESFRELRQFADTLGSRLVVFDVGPEAAAPSPHRLEFFEELKEELDYVFPLTFGAADRTEMSNLRHRFDDHWNETGNARAAEEMLERLQNTGLLE